MIDKKTSSVVNFHGMLSSSPQMHQFFRMLDRAAQSDVPVLMRGESGTGKELAARALHALSWRAQGPFHALNCATLTRELAVSELFGHIKGAFTGAVSHRKGLFEVSDRGSLFLDEIVETPLEVQARLLRVLQDQSFTPLGSTQTKRVNVRLISATHESLRQAVEEKRFRPDLMYRVRVIPLFLPALRERRGDILMLARRFLDELNQRGARTLQGWDSKVEEALLSYSWPGNIRELRNMIEYVHAMAEGPIVCLQDLTPELRGELPPQTETLESLERKRILAALEASGGSRYEAAKILNLSRSTLWRKLREYHLT
jgi:two-component system response regulator AtoC